MMVQPSHQHVAPCVKGDESGLGTRCLIMVTAFWAGMPVEDTQVVPRCRRAAIGARSPTLRVIRHAGKRWAYSTGESDYELLI